MDHTYILGHYANIMNKTCEHIKSYGLKKYIFTADNLDVTKFSNYCAYKEFSNNPGEIYYFTLCHSCEIHWDNLCKLSQLPAMLYLLDIQQKQIDELKKEIMTLTK